MPLIVDGYRSPSRWAKRNSSIPGGYVPASLRSDAIRIAFINNMPDSALEDTEFQFFELLDNSSGDIPVQATLYSLPNIPRGDRGQQHINRFYDSIEALWNAEFDGVIVTGTEPVQPDLRNEPYWPVLGDVLDWAAENSASTVLSCLAAHAGVLHSDGIDRHALADKRFGVFAYKKACDHALIEGTPDVIRNPHSRWNEVREDALVSCGYEVLTKSAENGVDLFVKKKGKSLFVHFQGHPEYGAQTLLKEYQRDIKRFIRGQRMTYPAMPVNYFDAKATNILSEFRENVLCSRREELMAAFPEEVVAATLENSWYSAAKGLYRNWLLYLLSRKADISIANCNSDRGKVHAGR